MVGVGRGGRTLCLRCLLLVSGNQGWCGFRDRATHGLTEAQTKELIANLRQGIGPDLDSMIARVGALRVRSAKVICRLKMPSLANCKQIREATNAY